MKSKFRGLAANAAIGGSVAIPIAQGHPRRDGQGGSTRGRPTGSKSAKDDAAKKS